MAPRQEERAGAAGGVDSRVVRRMDAPIESTPAKSGFLPCAAGTSYPTGEWTWAVSDRLRALDAIREAIVPLGGSAGVDPARSEIVEIAVEAREAGAAREALERLGAEPPPVLESLPEGERCLRLTVRLTESTPE